MAETTVDEEHTETLVMREDTFVHALMMERVCMLAMLLKISAIKRIVKSVQGTPLRRDDTSM